MTVDRAEIEKQIAAWKQEEAKHRLAAEQCAGARQAYEHLLASAVREFPAPVAPARDVTEVG